ncbi:MAG: glycosyltransferase [Rhodocyclaceae bacterium]|nr:glycosyltransferase [Rhodocyclaceae bacterium]
MPYLSIVIKTLNEEAKIAAAIESALAVEKEIGQSVEIIVADSVSTDRTVEVACRYPVRVVQFANIEERGCGAGVQLGFQFARGQYVYFLDGDMEIAPGFMPRALAELAGNPGLGGVGGGVEDTRVQNDFDRIRVNNRTGVVAGSVKWLEGGGLYRRQAIEAAGGHAADRNLRGYEEAELGMRLRHAGWELLRLPMKAVAHTGHDLSTLALFRRHWRSRRAMSAGVLLRGAVGRRWQAEAARMLVHPLAALCWWLGLVFIVLFAGTARGVLASAWLGLAGLALLGLLLRKRDLRHVAVSVFSWHYGAAAILAGLLEPRVAPSQPIDSRLLCDKTPLARREQ